MIKQLDTAEFRRRLAGLSDAGGGEDLTPDEYREIAADYVLLLAICFNRDALDATTLWRRIDGAIERGLAQCDGEDVEKFVDTCLQHIMASVDVVASNETALAVQEKVYGLDDAQRVFLLRYLADHRYPSIVFGRSRWQSYSANRKAAT